MGKVRAELSKKNPLYIDKHTFYYVYHFALLYPEWKIKYAELLGSAQKALDYDDMPHGSNTGDPTSRIGMRTYAIKSRIDAVESIAYEVAGPVMWRHLLYGVTHDGVTYKYLSSGRHELGKIACGKNQYYQMRRAFYYKLSKRLEETSLVS